MSLDSIVGQSFKLYSKDYVEFCDYPLRGTKRAEFYIVNEDYLSPFTLPIVNGLTGAINDSPAPPISNKVDNEEDHQVFGESQLVDGQIYCDSDASCQFQLPLPTRARRKTIRVTTCGQKYDLQLRFFSNQYLKLSVPRALFKDAYRGRHGDFSRAPETFEFVGILRDMEREKQERKEQLERERKNAPSSPKFSMFNSFHGW